MVNKYYKAPQIYSELAEKFISRGLNANQDLLEERLKHVNYCRLNCYDKFFKKLDDDKFEDNVTFEQIWRIYRFDRQLRLILLDAIERIEISIRTQFAYYVAHNIDAWGLYNFKNFSYYSNKKEEEYNKAISVLNKSILQSKEEFIENYRSTYWEKCDCSNNYKPNQQIPIWFAVEVMSFGEISRFISGFERKKHGQNFANFYHIDFGVLSKWISSLVYLRNLCAHHSRIWRKDIRIKPIFPNDYTKNPDWLSPVKIVQYNGKLFSLLTIIRYLMQQIAPQSKWEYRFKNLLEEYPEISLKDFAFPYNCKDIEMWKGSPLLSLIPENQGELL